MSRDSRATDNNSHPPGRLLETEEPNLGTQAPKQNEAEDLNVQDRQEAIQWMAEKLGISPIFFDGALSQITSTLVALPPPEHPDPDGKPTSFSASILLSFIQASYLHFA